MSEQNVEIVRRLVLPGDLDLARLVRDDDLWHAASGALAAVMHPDFEYRPHALGNERTYHGLAGTRTGIEEWIGPWLTYRIETEELIDCDDQVLALSQEFGRRERGQQEVKAENAHVWTIRDGQIIRWDAYPARSEALKAVGLEK